jgi:hypothetical protein
VKSRPSTWVVFSVILLLLVFRFNQPAKGFLEVGHFEARQAENFREWLVSVSATVGYIVPKCVEELAFYAPGRRTFTLAKKSSR